MDSNPQAQGDVRQLIGQALEIDQQLSSNDPAAFVRQRHALLAQLIAQSGRNAGLLGGLQEEIDRQSALNPSPRQSVHTLVLAMENRLRLLNSLCSELDTLVHRLAGK